MCDQQRLRPACAYEQSDQSLCQFLKYSMSVKLLTGKKCEFLGLTGGYTGSSESTLVKMPHLMEIICCGSYVLRREKTCSCCMQRKRRDIGLALFVRPFVLSMCDHNMSRDMKFPTMWYVRRAEPQISLCIRAV